MSLLAPLNLFFAALLGFIVALYMLRLKRRERVVSSNILWESAIRDLHANAPWQKLRSSLLMWLQLGFLILAVLALARPSIQLLTRGGQTVAIVLDGSASMGATDVAPSRFANAQSQAIKLINSLSDGDSATVLLAGHSTRVVAPLSSDKNALKQAISRAHDADTEADLRESIVLAASLLRDKQNPQIYVYSDGAVGPLQDLNTGNAALQFVKVGQRGDNLALTALDARRSYGQGAGAQVFATISNYSNREAQVSLELSRDGNLVEVRPVTVPAATKQTGGLKPGQASELFDDLAFDSGLFSARFDAKDDLATDNVAYAQLDAPREIRVLLAADNLFLEKALNLDPNVKVFVGDPPANQAFDVVVLDGSVPKNLPVGNQLVINTITPLCPVEKTGEAMQPSVADYDRQHPVARFAPWNDLHFAQSMAVKLKPWGKAVVEAERTPLIVAGERGGQRVVWCGFDLRETDLPLRVAFPIFVTNALHWLTAPRGDQGNLEGAPLRSGQPVTLAVPASAHDVTITAPNGQQLKLRVRSDGEPLTFDDTDQVGVYEAKAGNWSHKFAVSLLDSQESDLHPRDALQIGDQKPLDAQNAARTNRELWGVLAVLALGI